MREAGLTIGGFYGHFESKAAMDAEVIRTVFEPISSRALTSFSRHEGLDWLERAVAAYLSPINRDHPHGCPYPSILSAVAIGPPEVKGAFTDAMKLRVGAYEAHAPRLPGVTPRERALAANDRTHVHDRRAPVRDRDRISRRRHACRRGHAGETTPNRNDVVAGLDERRSTGDGDADGWSRMPLLRACVRMSGVSQRRVPSESQD
jgi:hypothetical protein